MPTVAGHTPALAPKLAVVLGGAVSRDDVQQFIGAKVILNLIQDNKQTRIHGHLLLVGMAAEEVIKLVERLRKPLALVILVLNLDIFSGVGIKKTQFSIGLVEGRKDKRTAGVFTGQWPLRRQQTEAEHARQY